MQLSAVLFLPCLGLTVVSLIIQKPLGQSLRLNPDPGPIPPPKPSPPLQSQLPSTSPAIQISPPSALPKVEVAPTTIQIPKLVSAHFMVGNTYLYTVNDWTKDMTLAASKGIDAFALNIGYEPWQFRRIADAYIAAKTLNDQGVPFKLFPSFDMTTLPCTSKNHGRILQNFVKQYFNHTSQLMYDGKMFVTTFAGSHCTFGEQKMDDGWWNVLKSGPLPVHLVTNFFDDPALYVGYQSPDGALAWNAAWPMGNYPINTDYDNKYLEYLGNRTYVATVSPWMFTHYGPTSYNKNFIYRGDDWLFSTRWELLIAERERIQHVEVISWNDYGESHYVGPMSGSQPSSELWTDGFDHQGWLDLMQYYITVFKTGTYPKITKDRAFLWGRIYPKDSEIPDDPVGRPRNWQFTEDKIWVVLFLEKESQVALACGPSRLYNKVQAGVSKLSLNVREECAVTIVVTRMGTIVLDFSPKGFIFRTNPQSYNFNAFVATSPA